jgi:hypothetical protein
MPKHGCESLLQGGQYLRVAQLEARERNQNSSHSAWDGQKCPCHIAFGFAPVEVRPPAKTVAGAAIALLWFVGTEVIPVVAFFAAAAAPPDVLAAMKRIDHHRLSSACPQVYGVSSRCL